MSEIKEKSWVKCVNNTSSSLTEGKHYFVYKVHGTCLQVYDDNVNCIKYYCCRFVPSSYMEAQTASGFKVGDKVKVVRKADDCEKGWADSWNKNMDYWIGKEVKITENSGPFGFCLETYYNYPFFVLEKVKETKNKVKNMNIPCKYTVKNKWEAAALDAVLKGNLDIKAGDKTHNYYSIDYCVFSFNKGSIGSIGYIGLRSIADNQINTEITLNEMLELVGKYKSKPLPAVISVGDYLTEWKVNEENKIDKVKVGCQTIDVSVIKQVLEAVDNFNHD